MCLLLYFYSVFLQRELNLIFITYPPLPRMQLSSWIYTGLFHSVPSSLSFLFKIIEQKGKLHLSDCFWLCSQHSDAGDHSSCSQFPMAMSAVMVWRCFYCGLGGTIKHAGDKLLARERNSRLISPRSYEVLNNRKKHNFLPINPFLTKF